MARFAAQKATQNKTPNAVNAFNLPAQQGSEHSRPDFERRIPHGRRH